MPAPIPTQLARERGRAPSYREHDQAQSPVVKANTMGFFAFLNKQSRDEDHDSADKDLRACALCSPRDARATVEKVRWVSLRTFEG